MMYKRFMIYRLENVMKKIDNFHGDNLFLSNFYIADVEFEGVVYKSSEHAFQAAKTLDPKEREMVANAKTPAQSKKAGKKVALREDWDDIKVEIMFKIVMNKFQRHPALAKKLVDTFPADLIEGNWWHDTFWGVCNGVGQNQLGITLMLVRKLLMSRTEDFNEIYLNSNMNEKKQIQCESCSEWFDKDRIYYEPDPFSEEIYGDSTPMWQCENCLNQSAGDI